MVLLSSCEFANMLTIHAGNEQRFSWKHLFWEIVQCESAFYREFVSRDNFGNILFPNDAVYSIDSKILISNHSSGFGANLTSLLGPLIYLARCTVFPAEISTVTGFRNFRDLDSPNPLGQLFARVKLATSGQQSKPFATFVHYVNWKGNYRNIIFGELLRTVLSTYFIPRREIVGLADQFFAAQNIDPSTCLSVFIRGTDGVKGNVGETCAFVRKHFASNKAKVLLLHTDDLAVSKIVMLDLRDLPLVICDLLPIKASNFSQQSSQPGLSPIEAGAFSLATLLVMAKSKFLIVGSGQFSLWAVLLRGNVQGVVQFQGNGHLQNYLYARILYRLIKITKPEFVTL